MSPIQQMLLGVGAVATKPYVDDVFSSYVYTGTGSSRSINTGIDMTEGGLVWIKDRSTAYNHSIQDTVRGAGATKKLSSNLSNAENSGDTANHWAGYISSFNNNGFSIDKTGSGAIDWANYNKSGDDYISWTFRKAPGFFDVVTISLSSYSTNQRISHSLGCIPGLILLKNTNNSEDWRVYHRELGRNKYLTLNGSGAATTSTDAWGTADATSTDFGFNTTNLSVGMPSTYVAYLFAGGEEGYNSVEFDGTGDYLSIGSSSDFNFGTGDFTIECWALSNSYSGSPYFCDFRNSGSDTGTTNRIVWYTSSSDGKPRFWLNGSTRITASNATTKGVWSHYALVRSSGTTTMYINGTSQGTYSDNTNYGDAPLIIGQRQGSYASQSYDGKISNFRVVKGTAVYTSNFTPPTGPLTNITNTKLLCCNGDLATSSTVTPGTITANGDTHTTGTSPFTSPDAVFGDAGDQNVIKCGSYVGSGSAGLEVNVGWEPSWVLIKNSSTAKEWKMLDSMRGLPTGSGDNVLIANSNEAETGSLDNVDLTSTGFKLTSNNSHYNTNGDTYIYMCIRRPDGYVGKPPELGTDVFAMDTGNSSSTIPTFDSGFPVDMGLFRRPASSEDWTLINRLTGDMRLKTNTNAAEASSGSEYAFDSNTGFMAASWANTNYQAWMWKRHAGFDVVTITNYDSTAGPTYTWHPHSLGKKPEMIWVKRRDSSQEWWVYHHGANGGTNPWNNYLQLHSDAAEGTLTGFFGESGPTATTFSLKRGAMTDGDFIFMLFASVDGISKVGYYDGSSTSSFLTITTGFQPRFLMVKRINDSGPWLNVDTTRGWVNGDDKVNYFNLTAASEEYGMSYPTSTGFVLDVDASFNMANNKYIYYCHA